MPLNQDIKKVLVIGSGPILIGSGAEFDYAGTQACKALKEEGVEVVLVNSNPATIMTDQGMAHKVYIQPLTIESLEAIIKREEPEGLLATLGGQVGLNMAMELDKKGILKKYGVTLLGTSLHTIEKAEDRQVFRKLMLDIKEPIAKSQIVTSVKEALQFADVNPFPLIVRPAYTMGGLGGGIAKDRASFEEIVQRGLHYSPINQVLVEECIAGWREIEYEVMRDAMDTCIVVCNMENMDPVGIHTGDSIVVAPSQTLTDNDYHLLRKSALKIISALEIEGGCNVQFAFHPEEHRYIVIEVNPRVSRSSALASKATGYPIAKISTKIALGYRLHEIINPITKRTKAAFEPTLDYVVTKLPKLPFDKFNYANKELGTQMQATGEVMAIGRSFESSFLKAVISIEDGAVGLRNNGYKAFTTKDILQQLKEPYHERYLIIAEALRRKVSVEQIVDLTKIAPWFIHKISNIIHMENKLANKKLSIGMLREAEGMGFTDKEIIALSGVTPETIDTMRRVGQIYPVYKMVDTCGAEFKSETPYLYSCFDDEDENTCNDGEGVIVVGSGPIRIGQGIEFDYASVHASWALEERGYVPIMVNNNPETVSTDFDISKKLFFEPLYEEDIINIVRAEMPKGVILQFGGQTAINLAEGLMKKGVQILGTSVEAMHLAEDRDSFHQLLMGLDIPHPEGKGVYTLDEAITLGRQLRYPLLVRPSFVIGGQSMMVVYNEEELKDYMKSIQIDQRAFPILIDRYIQGIEVEVDLIADGEDMLIPGIMEHIERTGVHSGDSYSVYPPRNISQKALEKMLVYSQKLVKALKIVGVMNIQYIVVGDQVYVIEVNPRASRTIPILSKVTGVPMVQIAIDVILGKKLKDLSYGTGYYPNRNLIAVKAPVFSFHKLKEVDVSLGPEMKSTGEVLGVDRHYEGALLKSFVAAGYSFDHPKKVILSVNKEDYSECEEVAKQLWKLGYELIGTQGTYSYLKEKGVYISSLDKEQDIFATIRDEKIGMVVNSPTKGKEPSRFGFQLREAAIQQGIPCFTCMDTFHAYLDAYAYKMKNYQLTYATMEEYLMA